MSKSVVIAFLSYGHMPSTRSNTPSAAFWTAPAGSEIKEIFLSASSASILILAICGPSKETRLTTDHPRLIRQDVDFFPCQYTHDNHIVVIFFEAFLGSFESIRVDKGTTYLGPPNACRGIFFIGVFEGDDLSSACRWFFGPRIFLAAPCRPGWPRSRLSMLLERRDESVDIRLLSMAFRGPRRCTVMGIGARGPGY
jgi:hypothetical protein